MSEVYRLHPDEFPKALLQIPDPPKELYARGNLPSPYEYVYLTIVGSRKYSEYGKAVCEFLVERLAQYPIVIVSGLALGMDAIAHNSALKNGLKTVAIPGSGLNDNALYPATNLSLARRILESGGALLSEFEPDFRATNWSFPRRNRLMAGISKGTLIIEAGAKSGSLITAYLAVDYSRELFAVPGSIFSETSLGTNELLRDGAIPVMSEKDILRGLGLDTLDSENSERNIENLESEERLVLDNLSSPISRDELIRKTALSTQNLNIILSSLEMRGLVRVDGNLIHKTI